MNISNENEIHSPKRNVNFEILRIMAAFGIVSYHANAPMKDIPYAGLVVFLALSPLVETKFNWTNIRHLTHFSKSLLIPWTFWFIVYAGANWVIGKPPLPEGYSLASLLYGSSPHLWFLPFIFIMMFAVSQLKRAFSATQVFWLSVIATAAILLTSNEWRPYAINVAVPYAQWAHAIAAVFGGLALGTYRLGMKYAWAGLVLMGCALGICAGYVIPGISLTYPIGLLLVAFAMFAPDRLSKYEKVIRPVSQCMFGVYLVHILAIAIVNRFTPVSNYRAVILIFCACLTGVFVTRRILPQARIVLG